MILHLSLFSFVIISAFAHASSASPHDGYPETPPADAKPSPPPAEKEGLIDLANEKCPIMGGEVDKEVFLDYEGVRIYFCCPGCDRRFLKDPAKYLKVLGIDDLARFKQERRRTK